MSDTELATFIASGDLIAATANWSAGLEMHVPKPLARAIEEAQSGLDETVRLLARRSAEELRTRAAFTPNSPMSSRFPVHYHRVPGHLRHALARIVGYLQRKRQSRWAAFPAWPIDLSADFVADLAGLPSFTFRRTPVLLTHDIDTPEGLNNLVQMFLPLEEAVGARSANYIVPCAWPIDNPLVSEIKSRGHEIGVHGYDHGNRTPFCDDAEREARVGAGLAFANKYGATGYRAPSLLRTPALLKALENHYRYDSSIPTAGGAFPIPNNGCASARPWRLGNIWEIPLTMPRDGSLRFLGHSPTQVRDLWQRVAEIIARSQGIVSLLTHCEAGFSGNRAMLDAYREFIEWIKGDSRFEFVRMDELAVRLDTAYAETRS